MLKLIRSYSEVQILMALIRNLKKGFITNFYPDPFKTEIWIRKQAFYYELSSENVFFFHQMKGYSSLFFGATSLTILDKSLGELEKGMKYIVDVISKTSSSPILDILLKNGFVEHCVLTRMVKNNTSFDEIKPQDNHIRIAKLEELSEVQSLIAIHFDAFSEQVPEIEELEQSIMKSQLILYEIDSQIAGFLIFDLIGVTLNLRFWLVRAEYRDQKVGSALLTEFFWRGKTSKRQLLWVNKTNQNAIKRYKHFGFEHEDMYDIVLLNY